MKKWLMLIGLVVLVVGCQATATPTPTPAPTAIPTAIPQPTEPPTKTPLPPTPTRPPTATVEPATNTPIPDTSTPLPTATNTRRPVTAQPSATPMPAATEVTLKYTAPQLVEPKAGDIRRNGQEDVQFKWQPVGPLAADECYLITIRVTNSVDQRYAELSYVAQDTCGDSGNTAPLMFVLHKRTPPPDYAGLVAIASGSTPTNDFVVTWSVMVVQNRGVDPNNAVPSQYAPVSPRSETFEFHLQG